MLKQSERERNNWDKDLRPSLPLKPWKSAAAHKASGKGRWLCESCLQYNHGSKAKHKENCQGYQPRRSA